MSYYALVEFGIVVEIIPPYVNPDGRDIPIEERYTADFVARMVDITDMDPQPVQGWTYDGTTLAAPVPHVLTPEEILSQNVTLQEGLLRQASQAMTPVLMSLQLGDATDAETQTAKSWQAYYRALQAVDVYAASPQWPNAPAI